MEAHSWSPFVRSKHICLASRFQHSTRLTAKWTVIRGKITAKSDLHYVPDAQISSSCLNASPSNHALTYNSFRRLNSCPGHFSLTTTFLEEPKMTAYMGCIGDDAFGEKLQQACQEDGVTTRHCNQETDRCCFPDVE